VAAPGKYTSVNDAPGAATRLQMDPRFTAKNPFAWNVLSHQVAEATTLERALEVSPVGVSYAICVSWHARDQCFETCGR
jgi:hypothetical protein